MARLRGGQQGLGGNAEGEGSGRRYILTGQVPFLLDASAATAPMSPVRQIRIPTVRSVLSVPNAINIAPIKPRSAIATKLKRRMDSFEVQDKVECGGNRRLTPDQVGTSPTAPQLAKLRSNSG